RAAIIHYSDSYASVPFVLILGRAAQITAKQNKDSNRVVLDQRSTIGLVKGMSYAKFAEDLIDGGQRVYLEEGSIKDRVDALFDRLREGTIDVVLYDEIEADARRRQDFDLFLRTQKAPIRDQDDHLAMAINPKDHELLRVANAVVLRSRSDVVRFLD